MTICEGVGGYESTLLASHPDLITSPGEGKLLDTAGECPTVGVNGNTRWSVWGIAGLVLYLLRSTLIQFE